MGKSDEKLQRSISELHDKFDVMSVAQATIVQQLKDINRRLDVSNGRLGKHDEEIKNIWEKVENFPLVKAAVFGLFALILIAFVGALTTIVFK